MKYSKEVAKLIAKAKNKENSVLEKDFKDNINCPACSCPSDEHEEYIYCNLVENYICEVCCRYELCNDHQLVNQLLDKEIFTNNREVFMICEECGC